MISYAQNFEDVMLARLFPNKRDGFYVDVGAHDPNVISVTRYFYDLGWHGINIGPVPDEHAKFVRDRPRDINLQLAVGAHPGKGTIHIADILARHCPDTPIDFLKIDVEGWEAKVLAGADFRRFRPVALVIAATKSGAPLTDGAHPESTGEWSEGEPGLLAQGYVFAHFDGLNRFYIRQEDAALVKRFQLPPGIFDAMRFEAERESLLKSLAAEEEKRRAAEERETEQLRENDRLKRLLRDAENASAEASAERDTLVEELEDIRNERNALARESELRRYEDAEKAFRRRYRWWFRAVAIFPPLARIRRHFDLGQFQEKVDLTNGRVRPPDGPLGDRLQSGKENAEAGPSQPLPSESVDASQTQREVLRVPSEPLSGPKISVITPSFNSGDTLERAILSVRAQAAQYPNYEHWVIDGGSTDGTLDILRKYPEVKWVSEPDKGQSDAMNKGFGKATGEVIVYLNADDELAPGAFAAVIPAFNAGAQVVMGKVRVIQENNHTDWINDPATDHESMLRHWESNAFCVNPVGYYYRREVQEQVRFDIANPDKMDLEFLLGVSARFPIQKVDAVLGIFHYSADCKTGREVVRFNYWQPREFAFLDPYIAALPKEKQTEFRRRQAAGYQARRALVVETAIAVAPDAIAKGRADDLLVSLPRPDAGLFIDDGAGNHLACRGDAAVIVLEAARSAKTKAVLAFLRSIPRARGAYPVYRVRPLDWRFERGRAGTLKKAFRRLGGAVTWIEIDAQRTSVSDISALLGVPLQP